MYKNKGFYLDMSSLQRAHTSFIRRLEYLQRRRDVLAMAAMARTCSIEEYDEYIRWLFYSAYADPGILDRIMKIYEQFTHIREEAYMQESIADFFFWLRDVFMRSLENVKAVMPDIFLRVNAHFANARIPTIETILVSLKEHFCVVPFFIQSAMFLRSLRRQKKFRFFVNPESPRAHLIIGITLVKWYSGDVVPWQTITQSNVKFAHNEYWLLNSKLRYAVDIHGRFFCKRLLSLSFSQILIKRLSHGENQRVFFTMLMRVLSG